MQILSQMTLNYDNYSITDLKIEPPISIDTDHSLFGIDPGTTKMGLAYLWRTVGHIYEVKIKRSPDPIVRILLAKEILSHCFLMFDFAPIMTIEGASFGKNYRQVELAEVRAAYALWSIEHGMKPSIVPPSTIRKAIFGSAKLRAEVEWDCCEYPNAASALACSYYPIKVSPT